ncbi:hypothetical protein [Paenibacillus lemnae]|uniref:hypothetical protein n=1 Tax=Paenibacillus lemnae TaxID=1330551 RepID=UPI00146DCDB3|nr:hypothetical protein [Paenibacillus lemnae]
MQITVILLIFWVLTGCESVGDSVPEQDESTSIQAVYLAPKSGALLKKQDLESHPEILKVHSFNDLKSKVSTAETEIWIDSRMVKDVDTNWLNEGEQQFSPLVLIGYHDPLYALREALTGFGIEGPAVEWDHDQVQGGFSVWILRDKDEGNRRASLDGTDTEISIQNIQSLIQKLQKEEEALNSADAD